MFNKESICWCMKFIQPVFQFKFVRTLTDFNNRAVSYLVGGNQIQSLLLTAARNTFFCSDYTLL